MLLASYTHSPMPLFLLVQYIVIYYRNAHKTYIQQNVDKLEYYLGSPANGPKLVRHLPHSAWFGLFVVLRHSRLNCRCKAIWQDRVSNYCLACSSLIAYSMYTAITTFKLNLREKGRYLTQSYDRSPYIHRKKQHDNTKTPPKPSITQHNDCGPT